MVHSGIRRDSLPGCGYTVWQDAAGLRLHRVAGRR